MVGAVTRSLIAAVVALIVGMIGRQAPEPVGREKVASTGVHDLSLPIERERTLRERDGEDLIGAQRVVVPRGRVENVVAMAGALAPEPIESGLDAIGNGVPRTGGLADVPGEACHRAQRVVPEGVDLDRLARARRDDPVAHFRVHPGELHAGLAGHEQSVAGILLDPVPRARPVKSDDLLEHRVELLEEPVVARGRVIRANCLEVPERRVDGIVLGRLARVGKSVREHSLVHESGECLEDPARDLRATGRQGETWQGDHGVASPVAEPVIARDHRHAVGVVGARTPGDELVGREHELADPGGRLRGRGLGAPPGPENLGLVASAAAPGLLAVERRRGLGGQHERQRVARL